MGLVFMQLWQLPESERGQRAATPSSRLVPGDSGTYVAKAIA